jgi:translocation and assembly module TamB
MGFAVAGGELDLEYLNLYSPDGEVSGFAHLGADGQLSGSFTGHALRLDAVSKYTDGLALSGSAELLADLSGSLRDPQLSGVFDLVKPAFREQAFSDGQGRFTLSRAGLALQDTVVRQGAGSLNLSGSVGYGPDYPLDLQMMVIGLPATTAVPLIGVQADLTGTLDGTFTVKGPAKQAVVAGSAELKDGQVAGFAYEKAHARFRYAGGVVDFEQLTGEASGLIVSGKGRLSGERLDLTVQADQLDLAKLDFPQKPAGEWRGLGSFRGTVRGPLRQPVVEGQIEGHELAYQEYELDSLAGNVRYEGQRLTVSEVELRRGQGHYLLSGEVEPALARMDLRLRFDATDLGELAHLAAAKLPYPVSGEATGVVHVWGDFKNPAARLIAETSQARLAGVEVAGDLDIALANKEVTVNRLRLGETAGGGLLMAQGKVGPSGADLQVQANGIDVHPLAAALGLKAEVSGKADAELSLTGTLADPRAEAKVSVAGAAVNGTPLSTVSGGATYEDGEVQLSNVVLASGEHRLDVTGTWPLTTARLAALGLKAQPGNYNLQVAMAQGDLSLFSFVLPGLKLSGPGSVSLVVTGPADAPQAKGEIVAQGVSLTHPSLGGGITRLSGRVELSDGAVVLRNLTGVYNGGQAALSGKLTLAGLTPKDLNLTLTGRNVNYVSPIFEAELDADLTIKGPYADAVIAGTAHLNRSTLTLGARTGRMTIPWDPNLNIAVSSREDMRVTTASKILDIRAYGNIAIRGRLHRPTFTGEAEASRGTIVYLNTPFTVTRGRAVFAAYRGMMPALDATAEARLASAAPSQGGLTETSRDLKVTLTVTGEVGNLVQNLSSDPPLSQADIIAAFSLPGDISRIVEGGKSTGSFEEKVIQMAGQQISNQVFSGLESAVAEALQLDQFTLAQGFQEKNLQMHVGKYLVDNVYLTYSRTLEMDPWEELGLEYRVRPGLTFTSSYDNQGQFQLGIESRFRF